MLITVSLRFRHLPGSQQNETRCWLACCSGIFIILISFNGQMIIVSLHERAYQPAEISLATTGSAFLRPPPRKANHRNFSVSGYFSKKKTAWIAGGLSVAGRAFYTTSVRPVVSSIAYRQNKTGNGAVCSVTRSAWSRDSICMLTALLRCSAI